MGRTPTPEQQSARLDVMTRRAVTRSTTSIEALEQHRASEAVRRAVDQANAMLPPELAEMMRGLR